MPPVQPIDPAAWRGVTIPFPDGSRFSSTGPLAPEALAMAQQAGLVPQTILDPDEAIRQEIRAYLQQQEAAAAPQQGTLPTPDISAYDRGYGGAGTPPQVEGYRNPWALSDEQKAAMGEQTRAQHEAAAARRGALVEALGDVIVPYDEAAARYMGELPPLPDRRMTAADRSAGAVPPSARGAFERPTPTGHGAHAGAYEAYMKDGDASIPSPAPRRGALADEAGPQQPPAAALAAPPAATASGGAGESLPGVPARKPDQAAAPADAAAAEQAFDPVKLFDDLAERFKAAEGSEDLTDEERRDLLIQAGLEMLAAASHPGATALGAAGAAGASAFGTKRALKREKRALNIERQKLGLDLAKTVTDLAMDSARLDAERAKMGYDAEHDRAVLQEQIRHNQAVEANSARLARAAEARASQAGAEEVAKHNANFRQTMDMYLTNNALAALSGQAPMTDNEIRRRAAFDNPLAQGAQAWAIEEAKAIQAELDEILKNPNLDEEGRKKAIEDAQNQLDELEQTFF